MKFRKKPVVIEAWLTGNLITVAKCDWKALPELIRDGYENGGWVFTDEGIHIPTLEGTMLAQPLDWVIQGVQGECYPCKPEIFEATYEKVECEE